MQNKQLQLHSKTKAIRHRLRVMSFVVIGVLCGACMAYAGLFAAEMIKSEEMSVSEGEGLFSLTEGSSLVRMEGRAALPLFALVLALLFGFGILRALGDTDKRAQGSSLSIH